MRRLTFLVAFAASLSAPASAQSYEFNSELRACKDQTRTDDQKRADFCTNALLRSADEDGVEDSDMATLLLYRSDAYLKLKDFDQAIDDADHASEFTAFDPQVHNMRCWTRAVANKDLDVAAKACDEAIRLDKDDPAPHDSRGLVGLRQQKWQDAYDGYREAAPFLTMSPSRYGLGLAALALGKTESGERWIKEALERDPKAGDELNGFGFTPEGMKAIAAKAKPN